MYYVIRKDRLNSHYGGVAAFVHRRFSISEVKISEIYDVLELLCFDLVLSRHTFRFFCRVSTSKQWNQCCKQHEFTN